jgi:DNA-binding NtrC family response regulator
MTQPIESDRASDLTCAVLSLAPVLLTGQSSSERQRHARFIHRHGYYSDGPFIPLHYSTQYGAAPLVMDGDRPGTEGGGIDLRHHLEQAEGGTVFIDEIENMSQQGQRALFSVLEQLGLERDTATAVRNVRIIAGTGRPLNNRVAAGAFMEALYYRLNVIHLDIGFEEAWPAVRPDDTTPLARFG